MEINNKFLNSATFGDEIEIESRITEIARETFVVQHTVRRGETVLVEGREVRIFAIPHPEDAHRIRALLISKDFSELLGCSLQIV